MTVYRVTGGRAYHDVQPGEVFEASLDPQAELRAVRRGSVVIIDDTPPGIRPGSYQPPAGWEPHSTPPRDAQAASLSLKGATDG